MARKTESIIVDDMSVCYVCGKPHPHRHHVLFGSNRKWSEKYGLVMPLCYEHHEGNQSPHRNREIDLRYKRIAQKRFEEVHGTRDDFRRIFGKSYL